MFVYEQLFYHLKQNIPKQNIQCCFFSPKKQKCKIRFSCSVLHSVLQDRARMLRTCLCHRKGSVAF